ncbi:MAG: hypothetical protein JKY23_05050, partial [Nitrospinaceae bacterium]|nr:hypothetical protein [Nitrospinaceae bacterium]
MKRFSLGIGAKIILLNGVTLLLLGGALLHVYNELGKATQIIEEQKSSLHRLETVSSALTTFSQLRYWMTDLAVSWQNEAEDSAMAERAKLEKIFSGLNKTDPQLITKLQPEVDSFFEKLMGSVDAYIDGNRVLGNSMVSDGRASANNIEDELNKLVSAAKLSANNAGEKVLEANAAIRSVSLILIVIATALAAILSLWFSRSMAARLKE